MDAEIQLGSDYALESQKFCLFSRNILFVIYFYASGLRIIDAYLLDRPRIRN